MLISISDDIVKKLSQIGIAHPDKNLSYILEECFLSGARHIYGDIFMTKTVYKDNNDVDIEKLKNISRLAYDISVSGQEKYDGYSDEDYNEYNLDDTYSIEESSNNVKEDKVDINKIPEEDLPSICKFVQSEDGSFEL